MGQATQRASQDGSGQGSCLTQINKACPTALRTATATTTAVVKSAVARRLNIAAQSLIGRPVRYAAPRRRIGIAVRPRYVATAAMRFSASTLSTATRRVTTGAVAARRASSPERVRDVSDALATPKFGRVRTASAWSVTTRRRNERRDHPESTSVSSPRRSLLGLGVVHPDALLLRVVHLAARNE